jgi:bifunctional aspartokinase / homoserine dehydrogenase 1
VSAWVVHKFGGTSLADAGMILRVADIVRREQAFGRRLAVVVSAMAKVTDALFDVCARGARRDDSYPEALAAIVERHARAIDGLALEENAATALKAGIEDDARDILQLLAAERVLGGLLAGRTEAIDEVVAGHGELWSARMLAAVLGCPSMDARQTLIVRPGELGPVVEVDASRARVRAFFDATAPDAEVIVITGYVAATAEGVPTTLKRNGSDHSASIFGALLEADAVTIWTDVDGVLSADPRRVPEAVVLEEMSYQEAMELAYFGARVVHPRTMQPAIDQGIPIWIKNTWRPEGRGTVIRRAPPSPVSMGAGAASDAVVKGFTTIDEIALLNLEGTGMVGVPGVAERLFGALRRAGVSVVVISQASSEHSICFAVPEAQVEVARTVVEEAFAAERTEGVISGVEVERGCSILAAVGDAMALRPGVAARFFGALADVGVNVRAVAQGSSERNITAVIDGADSTRALRAVHARFTLSDLSLSIGVVGAGLIGRTLLEQIDAQREELRRRFRLDLRVRAIAGRSKMVLGEEHLGVADADGDVAVDLAAFARHVRPAHLPHAVIVDCTASDDIADRYADWLAAGIHVVTPNKRAASGPLARWLAIEEAARKGPARYWGEATVGAGLPVMTTLKDLLHTGDTVVAVEGVLSGTLSWIFNSLSPERSFSSLVREAKERGYTEPDPREDLSGLDVARKLVVLGRAIGKEVALEDVEVEDLAPGVPLGAPLEVLLAALAPIDATLAERHRRALAEDRVLRFVGTLPEVGRPRVALEPVPRAHPFARLDGTDNILAFRTRRYGERALVVQGPGAGAEVTAGGVFADLLRVAAQLG